PDTKERTTPKTRPKMTKSTAAKPAFEPETANIERTEPVDIERPELAAATTDLSKSEDSQDITSLIEARSLQRLSVSDADEAWLESTSQKLRTALLGYGLQAKIVGT